MTIKVTKSDLTQMRVYPDTFKHPKMLKVSAEARWTAFELWSYCHKYRTDGHVPYEVIKDIPLEQIGELVKAGLMESDSTGAAWMHDYTDHQPSRAQLEAYEAAQAEQARKRSLAGQIAAGARWGKAGA
jgi:hypothetical protein